MSQLAPRINSATSQRAGSASRENMMLRNTVSQLEQQLMHSKAELQKVTDQLNCVITLVRRAWTGDKGAAQHVANIVGVAPPDYQQVVDERGAHTVAKPKSRAVNNWALLTIGLLNRQYKQLEREVEERQEEYLIQRNEWLEEQLIYNRDQKIPVGLPRQRTNSYTESLAEQERRSRETLVFPLRQRTNSYTDLSSEQGQSQGQAFLTQPQHKQTSGGSRPPSGTQKKLAGRHLYRPGGRERSGSGNMTWADLVIDPSHNDRMNKDTNQTFDGLYRMSSLSSMNGHHDNQGDPDDPDKTEISYDDPKRYTTFGLYDRDSALGSNVMTKRNRPPSGQQQKHTDALRSRPKSAAVPKSERPLKYETTRPISAQVRSGSKKKKVPTATLR